MGKIAHESGAVNKWLTEWINEIDNNVDIYQLS